MLTTKILLDSFEQADIEIIKQNQRFRYSFAFGNKKLKLVALSYFPKTNNTKLNKAKREIYAGNFIGEIVQSNFRNYEKRLTNTGLFFFKSSDLEIHGWKSQRYRYTLSNIEVIMKRRKYLLCEVLEIYSGDFYKNHVQSSIKKPEFRNIDSILFLEAFKYGFTLS